MTCTKTFLVSSVLISGCAMQPTSQALHALRSPVESATPTVANGLDAGTSGTKSIDSPSAFELVSYRKMRPPRYPSDLVRGKIIGTVYIHVEVNADGSVKEARMDLAVPESAAALSESAITSV